jgi:glycosyltransferase involved in cell wall biosynthesis
MAEYIKGILKGGKVAVIYNGVPQKYLQQDYCNNDCKIDFINRRKISLTYLGNMGYVQNLQVALETAKQIKSEMPEIYFYLIGDGVERRKLEKFIEDNMLDNVAIMGPVTKEQAMWLMQCSSALFFQLKDDVVMEKTVPSKVFDYMTAGKPILFGIKGEGKEILEQVKGNIFYQPDCVESFIEAVRILKKNYETLSESAIRNRAILQQQYIREKLVERLDKYLREMMQSF